MLVCDSCSVAHVYTGAHCILCVCVCVCVRERENLFQPPADSCAVLAISRTVTVIEDR